MIACTLGCNGILGISDIKSGNAVDAPPEADARVCNAGAPCEPANQCHTGVTTCSQQGDTSCVDTGTAVTDGKACAAGTCTGGTCSDPCGGVACDQPPASLCNGSMLTTYADPGTCDSAGGTAMCTYAPTTTDCADTGTLCDGAMGACVPPPPPDAPPPPVDAT